MNGKSDALPVSSLLHLCALDEMTSFYKLAAVEHAILGTRNWLNLLDFDDLEILEFSSDLKVCLIIPERNFVTCFSCILRGDRGWSARAFYACRKSCQGLCASVQPQRMELLY